MSRSLALIFTIVSCGIFLTSCGVNSNLMFKSPQGEHATADSIPMSPAKEYQISIDDKITFTLAPNDGTKMIESMGGVSSGGGGASSSQEFLVRDPGFIEIPVLGEVYVMGLTIAQCEDTLEHYFSNQYRDPFVQVKVTNQRVIVFPGGGSDASVIPLSNNNTTLMEVIAQAGGIAERGRAKNIKLMRRENGVRKVYTIDLSTIEGLKYSDMIVQANDYIYVEPKANLVRGVLAEFTPIITGISSLFLIFTIFQKF
jgi:polysaccharide export outer membrane protein